MKTEANIIGDAYERGNEDGRRLSFIALLAWWGWGVTCGAFITLWLTHALWTR
jgi:hypothetical protein